MGLSYSLSGRTTMLSYWLRSLLPNNKPQRHVMSCDPPNGLRIKKKWHPCGKKKADTASFVMESKIISG